MHYINNLSVGSFLCLLAITAASLQASKPNPAGPLTFAHPELAVNMGHRRPITCIAFTPNGRVFVTGSYDRRITVWDVATRAVIRVMIAPGPLMSLAVSPDGKMLASNGGNACILWNLSDGIVRYRFQFDREVAAVAFSPDGNSLAIGTFGLGLAIWDVQTGRRLRILHDPIQADKLPYEDLTFGNSLTVSFSADGRRLAESAANIVTLWDLRTWRHSILKSNNEPLLLEGRARIAFADNSTELAIGGYVGLSVWNTTSGKLWNPGLSGTGIVVACSKNHLLAAANQEGIIQVWDMQTHQLRLSTSINNSPVLALAFSPNGNALIVAGAKGILAPAPVGVLYNDSGAFLNQYRVEAATNAFQTHPVELIPAVPVTNASGHGRITLAANSQMLLYHEGNGPVELWNLQSGFLQEQFDGNLVKVAVSTHADSRRIAVMNWEGWGNRPKVVIRDISDHTREISVMYPWQTNECPNIALSADGEMLAVTARIGESFGQGYYLLLYNCETGELIRKLDIGIYSPVAISFSPDGQMVAIVHSGGMITGWATKAGLDNSKLFESWRSPVDGELKDVVMFTPDGNTLLVPSLIGVTPSLPQLAFEPMFEDGIAIIDRATGKLRKVLKGYMPVGFLPERHGFMVIEYGQIEILDPNTFQRVPNAAPYDLDKFGQLEAAAISANGHLLFGLGRFDRQVRIWNFRTGRLLATLQVLRTVSGGSNIERWAVTAPDGLFDTVDIEQMDGLHWVFHDDPFTPLSPTIFQRQYYEPRLLPRLLADAAGKLLPEDKFDEVPPLQSLNRVQPNVSITSVKADGPGTVAVTVKLENVRHEYQRAKDNLMWSGAKDLRLFRERQLVGAWPDTGKGGLLLDGGALKGNPKAMTFEHTFEHIQLPIASGKDKPQFTAYAFNTDDVRSETSAPKEPDSIQSVSTHKPKAYLVSMGVSAYQNPAWSTLDFAADDARKVIEALTPQLNNQFEVVPILLTSDKRALKLHRPIPATKQNLADVLAILSGRKTLQDLTQAQRQQVTNLSKLERAHPEDLVVVFFSGHGDQAENKNWQKNNLPRNVSYLFPFDIGTVPGNVKVTPPREKCISSEELAFWLRNVDAGNVVLIVDACHAAATVGKKFKPGPLGSRGMGQLAYDKGMRVLVATQSDAQALEVDLVQGKRKIQQGLLTYALVDEGLIDGRAGGTRQHPLTLSAWLEYAEQRVPMLEQEVLKGVVKSVPKGERVHVVSKRGKGNGEPTQKPQLFDFSGRVIEKKLILLTNTGTQ